MIILDDILEKAPGIPPEDVALNLYQKNFNKLERDENNNATKNTLR